MKYGLIGEKLGHSFSKEVHSMLSDYEYEIREIPRDELDSFMREADFKAINVTIPYKESVIPYLSYISEEAKKIGAVNTIVNRGGKLYGYNTDFLGMTAMINKMRLSLAGKKTVILGTGGTSKTAFAVAQSLGASPIITVSRTKRDGVIDYGELIKDHLDAEIVINTTPVGMYPDNYSSPLDITPFKNLEGVIDAIYNPIRTTLVIDALERGIKAEGGLYMLVAQAVYASEIFLDVKYPIERLDKIYKKIKRKKENIVLIGMPASGKSTVSALLANDLSRRVLDTDQMIIDARGLNIPEIFASEGETAFRDYESTEIANASLQNNLIIATGGGAILRRENVRMLKQNGVLFFIDRPYEKLVPTSDRPLASDLEAIKKRYEERYDIYVREADFVIDADDQPVNVAKKITGVFYK
ncbi:MAG: shikimate dehydrogenase [Clostridia bacterium]|nr:shikimate dehydrogenase [Clostridia bacterium]